jgi:hypothetical protein
MSYKRSRARLQFQRQIQLTRSELLILHRRAQRAGTNGSRLLGVYYVFAFAQLEVYVRTLVEDSVQALYATAPPPGRVPDLMLGYLLHKGEDLGAEYRRFSTSEDEGALLERVVTVARKATDWEAGGPSIKLSASAFLEKKKYPSPKNMPQLFRRLGIRHLWEVASAAGKFDARLTLTSLNDLRTAIAHDGVVPPGFGIQDFRDRLSKMEAFVAAIDRCVASHFCAGPMSRLDWNRLVA